MCGLHAAPVGTWEMVEEGKLGDLIVWGLVKVPRHGVHGVF